MVEVVDLGRDVLVFGGVYDVLDWLRENAKDGMRVAGMVAYPANQDSPDYVLIHLIKVKQ